MIRTSLLPAIAGMVSILAVGSVHAQQGLIEGEDQNAREFHPTPYLVVPSGLHVCTVEHTGERLLLEGNTVWRPMCGSDMEGLTVADVEQWRQTHLNNIEEGTVIFDNTPARGGGGLNLVLNLSGNVPASALTAIAAAEQYIEDQFGDNITIFLSIDFFNFNNGGVIGQTGSSDRSVNYSTVRSSMIAGMDNDDTIQDFLPTGSTIPVRYTSTSTSVTNENRVFFNTANFEATIGSTSGTDAFISFNTQFNFDYDPSNGVSGTDFQSVFIHEVGHALGFTSGTDFRAADIEALDIFRFSRNDSVNGVNGDWDPDTNAEFQTTARMVDPDNPNTSDDNTEADANSDLIFAEYRMSDGFPNQASHFNEGLNGIMDPTIGGGQTFFPNFYRTSDLTMFDAIGYDYPPSAPAPFAPVSPADSATGILPEAEIDWEDSTSALSYDLLVDDDPGFGSPEVDLNVPLSGFTAGPGVLTPLTTYYWTVDAVNTIGTTTMSPSVQSFTTTLLAPETFNLVSPPNFQVVSATPTLEWTESVNATEYLVELDTNSVFFSPDVSETVPAGTTQYTVEPGALFFDVEYFWRVTAVNSGSTLVSNPTLRRFTVETEPLNSCQADFNNDGTVDIIDFGTFGTAFGSSLGDPNYDAVADFNNDDTIDIIDFGVFGMEFNRTDCLD